MALEESSKRSEMMSPESQAVSTTPRSTALHTALSEHIRPDYTCYTLKDDRGDCVALIIETKLTSHTNVEPQVSLLLVSCYHVLALM